MTDQHTSEGIYVGDQMGARTVCRVCGHEDEHDPAGVKNLPPSPTRCVCCEDHEAVPVTIKPCDECHGAWAATSLEGGDDCDCAMLDGKPSPFPGWVVA